MRADQASYRPAFCPLPPNLAHDIVTQETGEVAVGPYRVKWKSSLKRWSVHDNGWSEFVVQSGAGLATCTLDALCPSTHMIRRGISARVDHSELRIKRNGPRLLNVLRCTVVEGDALYWEARGSWSGSTLKDTATSQTLWRSHGRKSEIRSDLQVNSASLVFALAANEIPQSMSLLFARI
jgi:hypothetical protein